MELSNAFIFAPQKKVMATDIPRVVAYALNCLQSPIVDAETDLADVAANTYNHDLVRGD